MCPGAAWGGWAFATFAPSARRVSRSSMQIVPVIDIKGGIVVHARRGQRADYAPLSSPLVDGCEPVAVARALCAVCRTGTLYVADLDALAGEAVDEATLAALASVAEPWVDAGATTPERAAALHRAGVARNVVGTESLGPGAEITPPVVLSVDLRDGRLISPDPELAGRAPAAAAPLARALGVHELLLIDLARVGSGAGPPLDAVAELAAALPGVAIYAGGGVRDDADLRALESAGAAGALVATALHEGRITL
jgi:HisA/HisF family protein